MVQGGFAFLKSKPTKKFDGKIYKFYQYITIRTEAEDIANNLRKKGINARITAHPGYATGGWDIYTRKRK